MKKTWNTPQTDELFRAILTLRDVKEARRFFRDLLTEEEIKEFSARWKVAQMLSKKVPYTQIVKETGMSSTTIARVSKWLSGGMNGYKLLLKRLGTSHHTPRSSFEGDS